MEKRLIDLDAAIKELTCIGVQVSDAKTRTVAKCLNAIEILPTIDAVPREEYKRLECELATMKAFMRYMAKDVPNPCQYCKHDVKDGVCTQECYGQGLEHFAFEWRGLPDTVFREDGGRNDSNGIDPCDCHKPRNRKEASFSVHDRGRAFCGSDKKSM